MRITVRLIDAGSRAQLWGEAYDVPLSDILAVPDKVTGAIVSTLHSRVESSLLEQSRRKPTLAAYECVLRGIKHLRGYGPDDNRRAVELFQQAMDLDPDYALARAYRAFAEVVLHGYGDAPDAVLDAGAVAGLDTPSNSMTTTAAVTGCSALIHVYRGDLKQRRAALSAGDRPQSERRQRHRRLRPRCSPALGRPEEGIDRIREAMRLNPYHPDWYWSDLGVALYTARRYADAAEAFGRVTRAGTLDLVPPRRCHAQMGRTEEAAAAAAEAHRLRPDFSLAKLRLARWKPAEAEHIIDGMRKAGLPE